MHISEIIQTRRSVAPHRMNGKKIDEDVLDAILESARWAPSHGMTQPWFFLVFEGEGKKSIMHYVAEYFKANTAEQDFSEQKYQKFIKRADQASHIIGICMRRGVNSKIPVKDEFAAVSCAVQNMMLLSHSFGVSSFWGTGNFAYNEKFYEIFGLTSEDDFLGFLYLGFTDDEIAVPPRKSMMDYCHFIRE